MKRLGTMPLTTDRLLLRRHALEDAGDMFAGWCNDPEVTRYLSWEPHGDIGVTESILGAWIAGYDDPLNFHWAVTLKDSGRVIGDISLLNLHMEKQEAEIGYVLGRQHWGQGYMTEALEAVLRFALEDVGFARIVGRHHEDNPASGRVMEKCGMRFLHTVNAPWLKDASIYVNYQYYETLVV